MIDENKDGEVHEYWQLLTDNILDQINYKQNLNKARAEHGLRMPRAVERVERGQCRLPR